MGVSLAPLHGPERIGNADFGRSGIPVPLVEPHKTVLPGPGVEPALERRGRAAEQRAGSQQAGGNHGAVAGMVTGCGFRLLVARIVLLVHHHQPELFQRQEERRPRPQHQFAPLRTAEAQVGLRPAAVGESRVIDRHPVAERAFHPLDELRSEHDFGDEQQHVLSA